MNILRPFIDPGFWIAYDHEPPPSNVVQFPGVAKANAEQAAMLLEADREAVRQDELRNDLMKRRRENIEERERIESAIDELNRLRVLRTCT